MEDVGNFGQANRTYCRVVQLEGTCKDQVQLLRQVYATEFYWNICIGKAANIMQLYR